VGPRAGLNTVEKRKSSLSGIYTYGKLNSTFLSPTSNTDKKWLRVCFLWDLAEVTDCTEDIVHYT
jgi:hypothetical protein